MPVPDFGDRQRAAGAGVISNGSNESGCGVGIAESEGGRGAGQLVLNDTRAAAEAVDGLAFAVHVERAAVDDEIAFAHAVGDVGVIGGIEFQRAAGKLPGPAAL